MTLPRVPLYGKVLLLTVVNLGLLALALALIARAQFRVDAGSFLLAPAENRITSVARAIALDLGQTSVAQWDEVLKRNAAAQGVTFVLFDEYADRVAGADLRVAQSVMERIPKRERRRERRPDPSREPNPEREQRRQQQKREPRGPAPPLFLTATTNPTAYWAGVRVPLRIDPNENPHPGTLLIMSPSLLKSPLLFDYTPWVTVGLAVVLISAACWLPFIRSVTRSITRLTRVTGQIAEGQFDIQVEVDRRDEIGQLGAAVNRMATRLAGFVHGQKALLSGIAHELCTPIATMQFGLGNLERRAGAEHGGAIADIQEEVQHMSALVNELLSFSRSGLSALDIKLAAVNLSDALERVLERESRSGVQLNAAVDKTLAVLAEPEYLFRALSNVVRNAIRYAGQAGPIEIAANAESGSIVCITISDSGPGVPAESLEQIFAPFYRLDPARSQSTGGLGLGLAIVRNCIEACQGTVRCRNRKPSGLEMEIRLASAKGRL